MKTIHFAIQASSTSWSGSQDYCTKLINRRPVLYWTLKNIIASIPQAAITIVAPEFDKNGNFNDLPRQLQYNQLDVFYGFNDSPLDRLIAAFSHLGDDEYIIRLDGLNFAIQPQKALEMYNYAQSHHLDCLKFPDDFPIHFTFDIYRLGALRKIKSMLKPSEAIYKIHPKYFLFLHPEQFSAQYYPKLPDYSDADLRRYRRKYHTVFEARQGGVKNRIAAGDQLNFHYEITNQYVDKTMAVLDIACGEGYGTRILSCKAKQTIGADLDTASINKARQLNPHVKNLRFQVEDATHTSFADASFDLVASMETIEHIPDDQLYMQEMKRILKEGGYFVFSTPQNRLGHIPMNDQHIREYSLQAIKALAQKYFKIEKIIGIKQGRIVIPNDPQGANTLLVCKKVKPAKESTS